MRSSDQFGQAVRKGVRTGKSTMVVHFATTANTADEPLVGFVVSKAIGKAVTRNLVKRRLRSIVRDRIADVPNGGLLVIRALPKAATADFAQLKKDLDSNLDKILVKSRH